MKKKVGIIILAILLVAIWFVRFNIHIEKVTASESFNSDFTSNEADEQKSLDSYGVHGWILGTPKKEERPLYIEKGTKLVMEGLGGFNKIGVTVKDADGHVIFDELIKKNKTYTFGKEASYGTITLTIYQGKYAANMSIK